MHFVGICEIKFYKSRELVSGIILHLIFTTSPQPCLHGHSELLQNSYFPQQRPFGQSAAKVSKEPGVTDAAQ